MIVVKCSVRHESTASVSWAADVEAEKAPQGAGAGGYSNLREQRVPPGFARRARNALGNAVAGAMRAAGVGIHAIGRAYAALSNIGPRHGIHNVT